MMPNKKKSRVIIFAKVPLANFSKTRLVPSLGSIGAAKLAKVMLDNVLNSGSKSNVGRIELCLTPAITDSVWHDITIPSNVEISSQGEGDLGERMARATKRALEQDEAVILIGTDCIEMSGTLLKEAFELLAYNDAVISPTTDGGYALLGLKKFNASIFSNISWSTSDVAYETILKIRQLEWSIHIGKLLHDVDTPDDLKHVPKEWLHAAI